MSRRATTRIACRPVRCEGLVQQLDRRSQVATNNHVVEVHQKLRSIGQLGGRNHFVAL